MTDKQLEMVRVMHGAGRDLLRLINDILDLSKIESGSATLEIDEVPVEQLADDLNKSFRYLAESKALAFSIELSPALPPRLRTDGQRLKQVLTNLLSNAIKFTNKGGVALRIEPASTGWNREHAELSRAAEVIAFAVSDTGIGIPAAKQRLIFEAFQQADAGTARRYGGTGLGLAISRELARLLGGELVVRSEVGEGSTFVFYLPHQRATGSLPPPAPATAAPAPASLAPLNGARPLLLVIEDDPVFARSLQELAMERGFDTLLANTGEEGLRLAQRHRPDAITLDLGLPDMDGWEVADRLRADPQTCAIAVHVISVRDRPDAGERHGVTSYTTKPADLDSLAAVFTEMTSHMARPIHGLLLIGDDAPQRAAIVAALTGNERCFDTVASGEDALAALHSRPYQGIVIDLDMAATDGLALLDTIRRDSALATIPTVLYTDSPLDPASLARASALQATVCADGGVHSPTVAVARFLARVKRALPGAAAGPAPGLEGRHALIVDDDARNLFALTGLLENYGMRVTATDNGREALQRLGEDDTIDIVLMDIMMPELDGYDTIRLLREDPRHAHLPVIALTAKAMADDREKCLAAGASDYASKPVDTDLLLAQLGQWLQLSH